MQQTNLWTRVAHWLRWAGRGEPAVDAWRQSGGSSVLDDSNDTGAFRSQSATVETRNADRSHGDHAPDSGDGNGARHAGAPAATSQRNQTMESPARRPDAELESTESNLLSRRKPRENAIEKLQEGYHQVVGLIDSIHKHMEVQDRRTEQIVSALNRLAETTAKLPEIADSHSDRLATIAAELQASSERAARWEQTLLDVPKIFRAQHETLEGIGRELAAVKSHEVNVAETLEALRNTLTTWSDASKASNDRFIELQAAASQRDQRMEELMREHNRRFTWFFASTVVLAVAAISTAIISLIR